MVVRRGGTRTLREGNYGKAEDHLSVLRGVSISHLAQRRSQEVKRTYAYRNWVIILEVIPDMVVVQCGDSLAPDNQKKERRN